MTPAFSLTVLDRLRRLAEALPDAVATEVDGVAELTYGALEHRSDRLAAGLAAAGVGPGDRVVAVADERDWCDLVVACYATFKVGGTIAPLSARLPAAELAAALAELAAAAVVAPGGAASVPAAARGHLVTERDAVALPEPRVGPDDVAQITRTSGTTGRPKLVTTAYGEIGAADDPVEPGELPADRPVVLMTVAVGTDATQSLVLDVPRGPLLLVVARFDPVRYAELIERRRVLVVGMVPSAAIALLAAAGDRAVDFSSVRTVVSSSAPLPPSVFDELRAAFPAANVLNAYALSEGVGLVNEHRWGRTGSIGRPDPATEVRIAADDGSALPPGEVGEIWLRRLGVPPRRHLTPPAAGSTTIHPDGWVATGDLGHIDADGFVYFVDRRDDLVVTAGHNVSTLEVEDVLLRHPAVRTAAAVGVPHPMLGSVVAAAVTLAEPSSAAVLDHHCARHLSSYKRPRPLLVVDELPLNASGKVLRTELRELVERARQAPAAAPADLGELVLSVWVAALGSDGLGPDDDLVGIGGFSLLSAHAAVALSARLDRHVPVATVLEHRTAAELARALADDLAHDRLGPRRTIARR